MAWKPLNLRQMEVLQWIANGCPDGVMMDFTYKTTAVALRNRHLVSVSKRGGWRAEITAEGRAYLVDGAFPRTEAARTPARRVRTATSPPRSRAEAPAISTGLPVHGEVSDPSPGDDPAITSDPETDAAPPKEASRRVPVPGQLRAPHPAVAALRDHKSRLGITALARGRALRILQALINAAELEGYTALQVHETRNEYGYTTWDSKYHLILDTGETKVALRVLQEADRAPHELTARELREQDDRWSPRPPKYDHTPNDRLRVEIDSRFGGRQHTWRDGKRGSLDDKLPALLGEISARHAYAMERRLMEEQQKAERERRREAAIERAKVLLQETNRARGLSEQASRWRESNDIRQYVSAMPGVAAELADPDERLAADEWVAWATAYADRPDPLLRPLRAPEPLEPTGEALRPFLNRVAT